MSISSTRMATAIDCYNDIAQLQQINGVPIAEIERRARPGSQFKGLGFLGSVESLKEVIQNDWKTVRALGTTHIALARHLRNIWAQAGDVRNPRKFLYKYGAGELLINSVQGCDESSQKRILLIKKLSFTLGIILGVGALIAAFTTSLYSLLALLPAAGLIAYQRSSQNLVAEIVRCRTYQADIFIQDEKDADNHSWNGHLIIENLDNKTSTFIVEGVIDYIEKYGFYVGGGEHKQSFRVDPIKLVSILSGASISSLQSRVNRIENKS